MIKKTSQLLITLGLLSVSHAATVSITNWELRNHSGTTTNLGGVGSGGFLDSITYSASGTDFLMSFSLSGDLDGCAADGVVGAAGDSLTFDIRVSAFTGSSYDAGTGNVTLGTVYDLPGTDGAPTATNQHFGPGFDLDANQSVVIAIENISYSRGEANVSNATSFNGFSAIGGYGIANKTNYFGDTSAGVYTTTANDGSIDASDLPGSFPASELIITAASGGNRFRDLDFSLTVADSHDPVPEPSSALLCGVASLLFLRRKR